jgi:hypothetical protein
MNKFKFQQMQNLKKFEIWIISKLNKFKIQTDIQNENKISKYKQIWNMNKI